VEFLGGLMIVLGIVLLVVGYLLHIPILWTLGIILVVVGAILALLGTTGRAIGGRRHYY
jgi:membrane protein implicated in regulation of membrane protease activity